MTRRCRRDGYECADNQSIYWAVRYSGKRGGGEYVISYWWYFRYNDGRAPQRAFDHEGDWEGVNVYVGQDDRKVRHVVFDQHGKPVVYKRNTLRFADEARDERVVVYVAEGRHASYSWPGTGQDVPGVGGADLASGNEYHGNDETPSGETPPSGEGVNPWQGNLRDTCRNAAGRAGCVDRYPLASRGSLIQGPRPSGWWASFRGLWGSGNGPPASPGRKANRQRLVEPFDSLDEALRVTNGPGARPRQRLGSPARLDPGCGGQFGAGIAVVACQADGPAGGVVRLHAADGTARLSRPFAEPDAAGDASVQLLGSAAIPGDQLRVDGPVTAGARVAIRAEGPGFAPYVVLAELPALAAGQTWSATLGALGGDLTAAAPTAVEVRPGLTPETDNTVAFSVSGTRGVLRVSSATMTSAEVRALRFATFDAQERSLTEVRPRGTVRTLGSGYRLFTFRVPPRTAWLEGRTRSGRTRVLAEANVSVQRVGAPGRSTRPGDAGEGAGRPTAR